MVKISVSIRLLVVVLSARGIIAHAQILHGDPLSVNGPANGAGIMVSGELWDSFLPPNAGAFYDEAREPIVGHLLRIGNFDRLWSSPTHIWPGGWTNGNFWQKHIFVAEYNPDSTFNPEEIGSVKNPAFRPTSGPHYALASFSANVAGASDARRNYLRETRWVDPQNRHHAVYEAGWPTNIGLDVKVRIHQFTLNWNNFNDFIIVEINLTNTGKVDINADGVVERTNNIIRALTVESGGEFMCSYLLGRAGTRAGNQFGAARAIGYVGDDDPSGAPWDIMAGFPGESTPGTKDMGLNDFSFRFYTDVWSGWSWLAVKQGSSTSDSLHLLPDKQTLYGTHPIGVGSQRGWFTSAGHGRGLNVRERSFSDPKSLHTVGMGTWYKDGGKSRDASRLDLSPNPNFFDGGMAGDPTSFVPKANPTRPNGDRKLLSSEAANAFEVNAYEGSWTKGFSATNNFDGDMFSGTGPFTLGVGESMTVVWAEAGGYRMQGLQNAIAAARWAFENGYNLPNYPAHPEMRLDNTLARSVKVRWDNRAESHPTFAGYKLYKTSAVKQISWLEGGMRVLDNYWKITVPGTIPSELLNPINPNFSAQPFVAGRTGVPDSWGPYELAAIIPVAQLGSVTDPTVSGFNYAWEDKLVDLGFKYWYYVAAYTDEPTPIDLGPSYRGLNDRTTTTLETSNVNRNGASGLWENTYPFADLSASFPKTPEGRKAIGTGFIVKSALASPGSLASGATRISVRPNPYKKKALFDSAVDPFDHKVTFYNLPPRATITVLDVSGQIIEEIRFESDDPNTGSVFWDLFSKDGIEVASGLYIYVVQYDGGQHVGYLSILR